jgi:hypothetical protein
MCVGGVITSPDYQFGLAMQSVSSPDGLAHTGLQLLISSGEIRNMYSFKWALVSVELARAHRENVPVYEPPCVRILVQWSECLSEFGAAWFSILTVCSSLPS